ncbi:MAG: LysM peptidoglycan-binding domain-containing protein [Anaerolineae bacterium]|nr:LysM peptidoglycan-binding domain-containing protein [Anaerolineae bacterium]
MVLNPKIIEELLELLTPLMQEEKQRRALLMRALGVGASILNQIDYAGSTDVFIMSMINTLVAFGEIEPGKQAIWALMETIRKTVGDNKQKRIDALRSMLNASGVKSPFPPPDIHLTNKITHVSAPEPAHPQKTKIQVQIDIDIDKFNPQEFANTISGMLGVPQSQITILQVVPGSVIVTMLLPVEEAKRLYHWGISKGLTGPTSGGSSSGPTTTGLGLGSKTIIGGIGFVVVVVIGTALISAVVLRLPSTTPTPSLTSTEAASPTPTPTATTTLTLTPTPTFTQTPTPTWTATPTYTLTPSPTPCVVRTDWHIYTVVRNDTLSSIAQRVGSTVDELAHANCLESTDYIYIGQNLRVPRSPDVCGDGRCTGPENLSSCCADCTTCGDGVCCGAESSLCDYDCGCDYDYSCESQRGENAENCYHDCSCGNGYCDTANREDSHSCPSDCYCGDNICDAYEERVRSCLATDCYIPPSVNYTYVIGIDCNTVSWSVRNAQSVYLYFGDSTPESVPFEGQSVACRGNPTLRVQDYAGNWRSYTATRAP